MVLNIVVVLLQPTVNAITGNKSLTTMKKLEKTVAALTTHALDPSAKFGVVLLSTSHWFRETLHSFQMTKDNGEDMRTRAPSLPLPSSVVALLFVSLDGWV